MELAPNDKRLGAYAADGSVEAWPEVDCFGQRYDEDDRPKLTKKNVGTGRFVVIPVNGDSNDLVFTIADMTKFTEPPADSKSRKGV